MSLAEIYFCLGAIGTLFVTGVGIVPFVPEELAVFGIGTMASRQNFTIWMPWLACIVGVLGTDVVLYGIGRLGGSRFFELGLVKRFIPVERRQRILEGFHGHGAKFLATGRLLPGVRTAIFMVAGAIRFPLPRFMLADLVSVPIVSIFYFGSFFFAEVMAKLIDNLHKTQYVVLFVLVIAVAVIVVWRWLRFVHQRSAANDFSPPQLAGLTQLTGFGSQAGESAQPTEPGSAKQTGPITTEHPLPQSEPSTRLETAKHPEPSDNGEMGSASAPADPMTRAPD
ncbi:MAG TPA: DedA family protein [Gemmatales bacterium]|nr:DedA family protein [Gemmatales bacterium]HMP59703.1 DedA family protein [Gemmatales bacterium]